MEDKIRKLNDKASGIQGHNEVKDLLAEIDEYLKENPVNIRLLQTRAEIYTKQQKFGLAINDYKTILSLDKSNKKAAIQIEQLQTILKYQNTDIFESPNTNFDPWLD